MRVLCFVLFMILFSFAARAERFTSTIHSIEESQKRGEDHLVFFTDGRVIFINAEEKSSLEALKQSLKNQETLEVERDKKNRPLSIQSVPPLLNKADDHSILIEDGEKNDLMLSSQSIFNSMRRGWQNESQCYNRAHVWAYEASKKGINMMKLFLFFTRRYIRNYNYGWWFHVTPALQNGGSWLTMDRRYTRGPLSVRTWTNIFVHSRRACPVVYKYTQYSNNQESQDCYLIPTTKYFWQPRDILSYERTGRQKTSFISWEVNWSYEEAF